MRWLRKYVLDGAHTFLHRGDDADRIYIALGGEYLAEPFRRYWNDVLISGVFNERTTVQGSQHARERVHLLGFVNEEEFVNDGGFSRNAVFVSNPHLLNTSGEDRQAIAAWPLQPARVLR